VEGVELQKKTQFKGRLAVHTLQPCGFAVWEQVTSLYGLDELILFSYYASRAGRYSRAANLGGNIGLHSIILAKLGYEVYCFEPDPLHISRLQENLEIDHLVDQLTVY